jgi:hypothetical protein
MASCKYYDAGWCYAPKVINANDVKGACTEPEYCPYLKSQMTEKERIEGEIKILQKKLALIEELEKTKSPVKEAFKRVYGYYPKGRENGVWTISWSAFQDGYIAAQEDYKVGEYQEPEVKKLQEKEWSYKIADEHGETNPYKQYLNSVEDEKKMEELGFVKNSDGNWTARPLGETAQELVKNLQEKEWNVDVKTNLKPQTPEQVSDGLKEAFREAIKQGIIPEVDKQENDKNFKSSLDLIREWGEKNKPLNLKELVWEWWEDIFTRNSDLDADASIDILVDMIDKKFIPPSSDRNGYEWEKCLKMMRDKLR